MVDHLADADSQTIGIVAAVFPRLGQKLCDSAAGYVTQTLLGQGLANGIGLFNWAALGHLRPRNLRGLAAIPPEKRLLKVHACAVVRVLRNAKQSIRSGQQSQTISEVADRDLSPGTVFPPVSAPSKQ